MLCRWIIITLTAPALLAQPAPKDVKGSADHPLVGRFEGSTITYYAKKEFDEAVFPNAFPLAPAAMTKAEGKLVQIHYDAPPGRSSLEIFRNFHQRFQAAGLTAVANCEKEKCASVNRLVSAAFDSHALARIGFSVGFSDNPRYGSFHLQNAGREAWVSLLVGETRMTGMGSLVLVRVLEVKPMETGKIVVPTAREMTESLTQQGRIALYGIYFDTGLAILKPESKPTLDQIAEALKSNAKLQLLVVGHTDNVGEYQANLTLSQRRAAAVVEGLTRQYNIAAGRLIAAGAGMMAPAASNAEETGRAKNRRVELVPR